MTENNSVAIDENSSKPSIHWPERHANESYEDYVVRRKTSNQLNILTRKGVTTWDSQSKGTYNQMRNQAKRIKAAQHKATRAALTQV